MHTILLNASVTSLYGRLWQPVEQPTQWTCMSITQVECDMQTVLNNSEASHPRMNRESFLGRRRKKKEEKFICRKQR